MGTFTIQPGETEKLADTTKQDASRFRAFVENNTGSQARLKFSDRRKNANTGTEILGGEQVQFQLEEGDALFAFNPTSSAVQLNVNPQGLALIDRSTVIQNASIRTDEVGLAKEAKQFTPSDFTETRNVRELQNQTGVVSGQNTGGGTLASNPVPDGRKVRVQALAANGSTIKVDSNFELAAGQAVNLAVTNTDKISYTANAGDGVCYIVES